MVPVNKAEKAKIHETIYRTTKEAKEWCNRNCSYEYTCSDKKGNPKTKNYRSTICHFYRMDETGIYVKCEPEDATHIPWGGDYRLIETVQQVRNWANIETGVNDGARIIPVKNEDCTGFEYIVIYKNHKNRV